jgi:hypothetical protein
LHLPAADRLNGHAPRHVFCGLPTSSFGGLPTSSVGLSAATLSVLKNSKRALVVPSSTGFRYWTANRLSALTVIQMRIPQAIMGFTCTASRVRKLLRKSGVELSASRQRSKTAVPPGVFWDRRQAGITRCGVPTAPFRVVTRRQRQRRRAPFPIFSRPIRVRRRPRWRLPGPPRGEPCARSREWARTRS